MSGFRQLPDGTWLNESTGTVSAPPEDGGPAALAIANRPALGEVGLGTRTVLIAGVIGIAALTVWLQSRGKAKTKKT